MGFVCFLESFHVMERNGQSIITPTGRLQLDSLVALYQRFIIPFEFIKEVRVSLMNENRPRFPFFKDF